MSIWFIMGAILAGIVFVIDLIARRKTWNKNTKEEKISLIISFVCCPFYLFLSILGIFWGIYEGSYDTRIGEILHDVSIGMSAFFGLFALSALILSIVFRKIGKTKRSALIHLVPLGYAVLCALLSTISDLL